jgi:hypothetical protein
MIDFDKFKYKMGDKIRKLSTTAIYEIIEIEEVSSFTSYPYRHYRLRNTSNGYTDSPIWLGQSIVHSRYEPCNPAIKVLYDKKDNSMDLMSSNRAGERSAQCSLEALPDSSKKVSR